MQSTDVFDKKIKFIIRILTIVILIFLIRLFQLQVRLTDILLNKGQKNFLRIEKIMAPRGNIVDTNGKLLVTNRPTANVYWQGTGGKKLSEKQLKILKNVEAIIDKKIPENIFNNIKHCEKYSKKCLVISDVKFEELTKLEELFPKHKNLSIETFFIRYYPHKRLASHVLGYLGRIGTMGRTGLEKLYNEVLKEKREKN